MNKSCFNVSEIMCCQRLKYKLKHFYDIRLKLWMSHKYVKFFRIIKPLPYSLVTRS